MDRQNWNVEFTMEDHSRGESEVDGWEWIAVDAPIHMEIERLPFPLSTMLQGRHKNWGATPQSTSIETLRGRSLAEVTDEDNQIKLGAHFGCFDEFDRCLDSWCVLNGRSSHRLESKWHFCLWVCRCGPTVRPR